ncbi:hypothetical protein [Glutamicibacter sp. AOP33-2CA-4]|uniref:hypothetical protein n=1 Tax=Glutamicibacter sp. AOP33-2CA-4 TaxID=3457690 RepID=UPI004034F6F6
MDQVLVEVLTGDDIQEVVLALFLPARFQRRGPVRVCVAERTVDPKDQRIRRIKATSLGREVIGELVANRPELADEILYRISADELRSLTIGLAAIARELRAQQQPR